MNKALKKDNAILLSLPRKIKRLEQKHSPVVDNVKFTLASQGIEPLLGGEDGRERLLGQSLQKEGKKENRAASNATSPDSGSASSKSAAVRSGKGLGYRQLLERRFPECSRRGEGRFTNQNISYPENGGGEMNSVAAYRAVENVQEKRKSGLRGKENFPNPKQLSLSQRRRGSLVECSRRKEKPNRQSKDREGERLLHVTPRGYLTLHQ